MGYVYVPTTMTVLKWFGIVLLYAVIIAIIVAAFRYFAHTIDLDYLFNIDGMCDGCKPLAYSWLVVSLVCNYIDYLFARALSSALFPHFRNFSFH